MSEIFSIKQEPELDILSDNEGDPLIGISTKNEGTVLDNANRLKVRRNSYCFCLNKKTTTFLFPQLNGRLKCKIEQDFVSINIKTESNQNHNEWTICDYTKNRSFQCYLCSKSYTTKQMLKLHINSIHMLLRPFKCQICLRSFADKYTLTTHARIHSGERPYSCPFCSKTFVQHSALTKHKRVHTKEKPYQCGICLKSFSDRSSLIPHRKIHTGELIWNRSFKCEICNAGFIKNSHLVRHNKTKSHLKEVMKCKDVPPIKLEESISC